MNDSPDPVRGVVVHIEFMEAQETVKKYNPRQMVAESRYQKYFPTLSADIQHDVYSRMSELLTEEKEYCDKGNYAHMSQILTSIALYEILQKHGCSEEEAYRIVSEEMWTGESKDFSLTLEPDYASNLNYKVTVTSGKDVISTTQNGKTVTVKALKVGTAKIQFVPELPSSSDIKTECVITVKAHVSSVSIKGGDQNIDVGKTTTLEAIVSPNDADDKSVTWAVDNSEIATIDNSGKVTGVSPGTATVTITTTDSGKTATCKITVNQPVDSVTLDKNTLTLTEGQSETLKATANPEQADQSFTWSSNNTSVATVDSNGKVTAVKAGTADITATSKSNPAKYTTCRVTVRPAVVLVSSIPLDPNAAKVEKYPVPDNYEPIYFVDKDKEMRNNQINVCMKIDAMPDSLKGV